MKILAVLLIIVSFTVSFRMARTTVEKLANAKSVSLYRSKYVSRLISIALIAFHLVLLVSALGFEYSQVSIFLSSMFAIIGVALFAQWSILSNITASLIIFFGFPYRVGDRIKVIDKDDDISGIIEEISLFHVLIKRGEEIITYPNSLILQKGVIKDPVTKTAEQAQIAITEAISNTVEKDSKAKE